MNINDAMHLRGEVLIQTVSNDGSISTLLEDKNLIVANGRTTICDFLAGTLSSSNSIYDVAFGKGGTVAGNTTVALPVDPSDTTVNSLISATSTGVTPDYTFSAKSEATPSPRVVCNIVVPNSSPALNGQPLSELALMLNSTPAKAFAIKRFPTITKSDTVILLVTWVIYV